MTYTAKYTPCGGHTPATIIGTFWTRSGAATACRDHFHQYTITMQGGTA